MIKELRSELRKVATPEKAKASAWFFKTGEGQYGYGDKFLGVTVPEQRAIAKKFGNLNLEDIQILLNSEFHEERLTALFILVGQYEKAEKYSSNKMRSSQPSVSNDKKKEIYNFYLANTKYINNWDLVDSSAHKIVGEYLLSARAKRGDLKIASSPKEAGLRNDIEILHKLAHSTNLWEKRIAIISTASFIGHGRFQETFEIADILLHDRHDLIQKAVGWMLREVGKRVSKDELVKFLKSRYKTMPRTALRYAIEHFPPEVRKAYLHGTV